MRLAAYAAVVAVAALAVNYGLRLRRWTWDATLDLHFGTSPQNALMWGHYANTLGYLNVYDELEKQRGKEGEFVGAGVFPLDYPPLRLLVAAWWADWAAERFAPPAAGNLTPAGRRAMARGGGGAGRTPVWRPDYEFHLPMIWLNIACELLSALAAFLLVRHWARRCAVAPPGGQQRLRRWWQGLRQHMAPPADSAALAAMAAALPPDYSAARRLAGGNGYANGRAPAKSNGGPAAAAPAPALAAAPEVSPYCGLLPGLLAAILLWFSPALIWNAHVFPQWDVWLLPGFLFAIYFGMRNWWAPAGFVIGVVGMAKGQVFLVTPVFALWPLFAGRVGAVARLLIGLLLGIGLVVSPWLLRGVPEVGWREYLLLAGLLAVPMLLARAGTWKGKFLRWGVLGAAALVALWPVCQELEPRWAVSLPLALLAALPALLVRAPRSWAGRDYRAIAVIVLGAAAALAAWPWWSGPVPDLLERFILAALLAQPALWLRDSRPWVRRMQIGYAVAAGVLAIWALAGLVLPEWTSDPLRLRPTDPTPALRWVEGVLLGALLLAPLFQWRGPGVWKLLVRLALTAGAVAAITWPWLSQGHAPVGLGVEFPTTLVPAESTGWWLARLALGALVLLPVALLKAHGRRWVWGAQAVAVVLALGVLCWPAMSAKAAAATAAPGTAAAKSAATPTPAPAAAPGGLGARPGAPAPPARGWFVGRPRMMPGSDGPAIPSPTAGLSDLMAKPAVGAVVGRLAPGLLIFLPLLVPVARRRAAAAVQLLLLGLIAAVAFWPDLAPAQRGGVALVAFLAAFLALLAWVLPRRALGAYLAGAVAVALFLCVPLFDGSMAWYTVGIEYGTRHWKVLAWCKPSNLGAILQLTWDWNLYSTVDLSPILPWVKGPVTMPLRSLMIDGYALTLLLCSWGAARHYRRHDPRLLWALVAPWVIMFAIMPQMLDRYLVWGAAASAIVAVQSVGGLVMFLVLNAITWIMMSDFLIGNMSRAWFSPEWVRFIRGTHPALGWGVLVLAGVSLYLAMAPGHPRWQRQRLTAQPPPEPELLQRPAELAGVEEEPQFVLSR